jgi:tRNA (guanine26-N2/guanine27-N2)-dimethyltransferase
VPFCSAGAFFRPESAQSRDLAVLQAAVMRDDAAAAEGGGGGGGVRVLDAMCGCGLRGARYLVQGGASHAHCNDADPAVAASIAANLTTARRLAGRRGVLTVDHAALHPR